MKKGCNFALAIGKLKSFNKNESKTQKGAVVQPG